MSAAELEAPRPLRKPGDTDAVTFSWADPAAGLYGLARVASGLAADGAASSSALAVAFAGRETLGAIAEAGATPPPELAAETEAPLERWTCAAPGELEFELDLRGADAAGGVRRAPGGRQGRRDGGLRAALPRARDDGRHAASTGSASAGTRGATRTGTRSR